MLKYFITKVCGKLVFAPKVMVCVPSCITEVEKKAVIDAATNAGAKKVYLIEEPIAAAIGAGIDIGKPYGSMIVDIGGGTTDIAVISLGGTVKSKTIRIAGDKFDEAIMRYLKKNKNIIIGERTAEDIKINVGCMYPKTTVESVKIKGRDVLTGLPTEVEVTSEEMLEALRQCAEGIVDGVHSVLEETPPELLADISARGIYITGGGGLINGLDKLLSEKTLMPVMIAQDPISCVAIGTGKALNHIELLESGNALKIKKF
jgi:rod shape-determining protein MreB and related proteins